MKPKVSLPQFYVLRISFHACYMSLTPRPVWYFYPILFAKKNPYGIEVSFLLGYCAASLGDCCWTFRDIVVVSTAGVECQVTKIVHVNKCPTRCNYTQFILSVNCPTCFGWFLVNRWLVNRWLVNGSRLVPDAVDTVICAPDDGWRKHSKHVEQFTGKINCVYFIYMGPCIVNRIE